jgi:hypothetical protein
MRVGSAMRHFVLPLIAILFAMPACKKLQPAAAKEAQAERDEARDKRIRQACASQASYERLKALAFEKADEIRAGNAAMLDQLAAATVVRMEDPVVKSRDEALNVTVCKGRMIIDLPPGTEDVFNGERRLVADVEYAAQAAADGSGMVYQLDGAEPIVYKLAAIDLKGAAGTAPAPALAAPTTAAAAPPAPTPTPEVKVAERPEPAAVPIPTRRPAPQPQPAARAAESPRPALARPSFNCRYARTRTEQMVCSDERLAARDRAMASQYYSAIANSDPETRAILRRSRDRFLAERERCDEPQCVAERYEDRIDEIERMVNAE